ncbi:hypothetical protein B0T09DRAFT_400853 [Sordaria sp. MPI-SDFR-AT-0083]|nr:hypothetical protein B0T09DRAFT_400853 [Sordaria sp. MPI-SDFR-AT-0083]
MYEAFREHQQEKCAYEADQIYQVSLKGGGGVVDEAREMFEAFRECQKQQNQRWEQRGEEEEEAVDEQKEEEPEQGQGPEQGVFAGLLERTYKLNYQTENSQVSTPVGGMGHAEPGFYGCLGEWVAQFEPRTTVDHCLNHPVEPTSKSCSELIDITTEAIDAYQCLDLWAKQFDDNASNDTLIEILHSETNTTITSAIVFGCDHAGDHSPLKGLRTKAIVTAASDIFYDGHNAADDATLRESYSETTATNSSNTDIFYDGNSKTTNTTAAITPEQDNNHSLGAPLRLKTPEDFARYKDLPRLWFYDQCQQIESHGRSWRCNGRCRFKGKKKL